MIEKIKKLNILRLAAFCIATYSLAVFFEAGRLIANEKTLEHLPASIFSAFVFSLCVFFMGYWVYKEEKEKNNLRVKFDIYEWFYSLERKKSK